MCFLAPQKKMKVRVLNWDKYARVQGKINFHNSKNRVIIASWNQNGAQTNQIHKTHHDPNLQKNNRLFI